jgi:hypothetical protein
MPQPLLDGSRVNTVAMLQGRVGLAEFVELELTV